ncbi:MAG: multicopper oxidase domain-containing protein [Candidatus Paceibacteria bacterium]
MQYKYKTTFLTFLLLGVLLFPSQLAAHGNNHDNGSHTSDETQQGKRLKKETNNTIKENPITTNAVISVISDNVDFISIIGVILVILLSAGLVYDLYKKEIWELPQSVSFLFIIAILGVIFSLYVGLKDTSEPLASFGPGQGPMHMEDFYTQFNKKNFERLQDFTELPVQEDIVRDPANLPEQIDRKNTSTVHITLTAQEVVSELADGTFYYYWTYKRPEGQEKVPGPILRVKKGDTVVLTLKNDESSTHEHSIDLHAVTGPGGGAGVLKNIKPGEEKTIKFKAMKEGFYVYHCASDNIPTHISNQMFGGIIVEPRRGMKKVDKEFVLFQGELYTKGPMGEKGFQAFAPRKMLNENPSYYTFNGKPHGVTGKHKMRARAGDDVRLFFGNMGNSKTSSFHIIGEIFDRVYAGDFDVPRETNAETVPVAAGQAITVEFKTEVPGSYTPVDHALSRLDRGAWGKLKVRGEDRPQVYKEIK